MQTQLKVELKVGNRGKIGKFYGRRHHIVDKYEKPAPNWQMTLVFSKTLMCCKIGHY